MWQVVVFLKGLAKNGAEERRQLVEVKMEQGTENFAGRVADLQADHATAGPHDAQHFAKALANVREIAYGEGRAAAIDTIIGQIDLFGITHAQFDLLLQTQPFDLAAPFGQHFGSN